MRLCCLKACKDADRRRSSDSASKYRAMSIFALLRRSSEGPAPRAGRAARSRRCGVCARRPGRSVDRLSVASRRSANFSIPTTARICSRAPSARAIFSRSRRRRTSDLRRRARCRALQLPEEKALAKAIDQVKAEAGAAVAKEDFAGAMSAMAKLRPAVDAFFDKVKVNDDDPKVRENRLKLLNEIRAATRAVADFSEDRGLIRWIARRSPPTTAMRRPTRRTGTSSRRRSICRTSSRASSSSAVRPPISAAVLAARWHGSTPTVIRRQAMMRPMACSPRRARDIRF